MNGEAPKRYADLQKLLTSHAATRWVAYVIGCLCVLMHEQGVRLKDCLTILISSDIPEGVSTEQFHLATLCSSFW